MKTNYRSLFGILSLTVLFTMLFSMGAAVAPAFAQTEPPIEVQPTVIVPDTGDTQVEVNNTDNDWLSSWVVWIILGAIVIALLTALIARGSTPTHHDHID